MGPGIAHTLALAGISVKGFDMDPKAAELCAKVVHTNLGTLVEVGRITQEQADAAEALISYTSDLSQALPDAQLVVEGGEREPRGQTNRLRTGGSNGPGRCPHLEQYFHPQHFRADAG